MVSIQSIEKKEILRMVESDVTTMTYVFDVKTSMKAAKFEFRTSIDWNCAANLLLFNKTEVRVPHFIREMRATIELTCNSA